LEATKAQNLKAAQQQVTEQALKISTQLFGTNALLMLPHVQQRMQATVDSSGVARVELLDAATGGPSIDQNLDNFRNSLSTNETFKGMVVLSNASGGSANDSKSSSATTTKEDGSPKKYKDFKSGELVLLKRNQPDVFEALLAKRNES